MKDILKMYLFRLFKDKVFWIFLAIGVGIVVLETFVLGFIANILKDEPYNVNSLLSVSYESLTTMDLTGKPSLIGPIFCFFFLTREFHDGTIRNMILSGKKRIDIYISAGIIALFICYVNIVVDETFIWSLGPIFGVSTGLTDAAAVGSFFSSLGVLLILSLLFVSIALCLCFLVPNAFGSFGIYIGIVFGFAIIYGLVSIILPILVGNGTINGSFSLSLTEAMTTYQISYFEQYPFAGLVDSARIGWVALWASGETVVLGGAALFLGGWKFNKADLK